MQEWANTKLEIATRYDYDGKTSRTPYHVLPTGNLNAYRIVESDGLK